MGGGGRGSTKMNIDYFSSQPYLELWFRNCLNFVLISVPIMSGMP